MIRRTIEIGRCGLPDWSALRDEGTFLYRAIADRGRAVLGVGIHHPCERPVFNSDGMVQDWVFGHRCYDPGPDVPNRLPIKPDGLPMEQWWIPRVVVEWREDTVLVHALASDETNARDLASRLFPRSYAYSSLPPIAWRSITDRRTYLDNAAILLRHIQRGDIYEVNYCTERRARVKGFDPFAAFAMIMDRSKAPFAAFSRSGLNYAMCASPERFLAFEGRKILGQPMKGTRPRSQDEKEDLHLAETLRTDAKERSENIMALDVMRNDLSRVAARDSVRVEELCAIRSYHAVHQMISTVSAELRKDLDPMDALHAAFPMASMTGAPKIRAMQLIQEVEEDPRGLFSGTLGFFAPDGTGDLNVVIRTLLFDAANDALSLTTGSALTATCDPKMEWEECELKAASIMNALSDA